jgi:hypothetical protein
MSRLLAVPKGNVKDVFTLKNDGKYFGVIEGQDNFFVCLTEFDSPLKAANHARSLKRKHKIGSAADILKKSEAPKIRPKVQKKKKLFTEAEVATRTHLRYREVWVITNPAGKFVVESIKNKTLVKYSDNKDSAEVFNTYEEALFTLNTLDMVVKKGHQLRRYFESAE